MHKYNYLLNYNPNPTAFTLSQLHVFITQNRNIFEWYVPSAGTYLFKSPLSLAALNDQFHQFFSKDPYMLTWLAPGHTAGSLPPAIWDWLNGTGNPLLPDS